MASSGSAAPPPSDGKRSRGAAPGPGPADFISRNDFRSAFDQLAATNSNTIADTLAKMAAGTQQALEEASRNLASNADHSLAALDRKLADRMRGVDERINTHDVRLAHVEHSATAHDQALAELRKRVDDLGGNLSDLRTAAPPPALHASDDYHRATDPTILRLRSKLPLPLDSVRTVIEQLAVQVAMPSTNWALEGDALAKAWVVRFSGCPVVAAKRAAKLQVAPRGANGVWCPLLAAAPGGTGATEQIFLDHDKSKAQIALERATKKLSELAKAAAPDLVLFPRRRDFTLFHQWAPLARISSDAPGQFLVRWNAENPVARRLRDLDLHTALSDAFADPADRVRWL